MIFPSLAQQFTWQHLFFDSFPFITSIRLKGRQWRHLDALRQDFPCFSPFPSHTTTRYGSQKGATENVEGTLHIFFCWITEDSSSRFEGDILPIFRKRKKPVFLGYLLTANKYRTDFAIKVAKWEFSLIIYFLSTKHYIYLQTLF